jgi:hypothetical protein
VSGDAKPRRECTPCTSGSVNYDPRAAQAATAGTRGPPFILPLAAFSVICVVAGRWRITPIVTLLTIYITAFFRTLEPQVPGSPAVAVLPGDGRSLAVVAGAGRWRISFGSRTDFILPPEAEVKQGSEISSREEKPFSLS